MKERPILFSALMVRAILEGRKTQTRRVVKPQPEHGIEFCPWSKNGLAHTAANGSCTCNIGKRAPVNRYGFPGDRLWVRETWRYADWTEDGEPWIEYAAGGRCLRKPSEEWVDRVEGEWADLSSPTRRGPACDGVWRSPMLMPRWASRITLEVVGVRVDRLQQISEQDAKAEGVEGVAEYAALWDSINGGGSWAENPWVWVVEFRAVPADLRVRQLPGGAA